MSYSGTKFQSAVEKIGRGAINLNSDTLKIALTNSAPNAATNDELADITEISAAYGYSAGGTAVGSNAYSQTSGTGKLTGSDVTFTAAGGNIGPFRYVVLYDATASGSPLICYWDLGSGTTINDGSSWTVNFHPSNGILTIQ